VTDTLGIVIVCYGDNPFYLERSTKAIESAVSQTVSPDEIRFVYKKKGQLHRLLNQTVAQMRTDFVCRLDADDWLSDDYVESFHRSSGDIRKPYIETVNADGSVVEPRHMLLDSPIMYGNHIVSAAPVNRKIYLDVGGYKDYPLLEDHDLFIRMLRVGAALGHMDGTLYYTQHPDSRNRADHESHLAMIGMFRTIYQD
jgi:glycosyltransferase involved in cell wall biosynthesis